MLNTNNIKFIFENISTISNFLDVSLSIKNDHLIFDVYHKPTQSFSYLYCLNCHPQRNKNDMALSMRQRIVYIVSEKQEQHLTKLKLA